MQQILLIYIVSAGGVLWLLIPVTNYAQVKDSLSESNFTSGIRKYSAPSFSSNGRLSAGYEYGIIPFNVDSVYPSGYFKSEGTASFQCFRLPLMLQYYFTTLHANAGLNNYFRISYDEIKYKDGINLKNSWMENDLLNHLHLAELNKQATHQKLLYLKSLEYKFSLPDTGDFLLPDFPGVNYSLPDSLKNKKWKYDKPDLTLKNKKHEISDSRFKKDSLAREIQKVEKFLKKIQNEINELNKKLSALKKAKKEHKKFIPEYPKDKNKHLSLKKLELGLCYPAYSTFLINGSAVNGVNAEMESEKYYLAVTYGKTMNSLQVPRNVLLNSLQNVRNLFNYFDFTDVRDTRRIAAMKFGVGKKEGTHIYLGFLQGAGLLNYIHVSNQPENQGPKEKNYVAELDGCIVFNSYNKLEFVYGKSLLQRDNESYLLMERGFPGIISKTRSHAAKLSFTKNIPATGTELSAGIRWVDPFFKSYGVGFIRSDNVRYEIKATQPVSSKIKITSFYKRENDNLMALYTYKNILNTVGNTIQWKINRSISFKAGYTPVFQKVISREKQVIYKNYNHIGNFMISFNPKWKVNTTFLALANYYKLAGQYLNSEFKSYTFSNVIRFNETIGNTASVSWFFANTTDSINGVTTMLEDEFSWTIHKGITLTTGLKLAKKDSNKLEIGYSGKLFAPVQKHLAMEFGFEKLIVDEFYNYYLFEMNNFPYLISGKMIFFW